MRALSLHLIEGSIDEVSRQVSVTWVQPRVLDRDQVKGLRERLGEWSGKVRDMTGKVEKGGEELFASA